ncbi:MAG: hypothetical protein ACLGHQ_08150 [Acidimicrobiia bacterium]
MRQIFTVRFFAAVGAVVGLFFLLSTIFATREVIDGDTGGDDTVQVRELDFAEQVFSTTNPSFRLDDDGLAANDTELVIDGQRRLRVVAGTPGEVYCDVHGPPASCAVVADLLGEGVVWFALVPDGPGTTIELPAIDVLEDGRATLVNGWRLPYASVLDRRCRDENNDDVEFSSYREFRETLGDDFTSIYDSAERRLVAVECRTRVPYAPEPVPTTTTTTTSTSSTLPLDP